MIQHILISSILAIGLAATASAQPNATNRDARRVAEDLTRQWEEAYNTTWLIERHGFRPPAALREKQLSAAALAA